MKTVISGRIIEKNDLKEISTIWNDKAKVINLKLAVVDDKGKEVNGKKPTAIYNIEAWENNAKTLSEYKEGDIATLVVTPRVSIIPSDKSKLNKDVSVMRYVVSAVDKTNTLDTQLDNLLSEFSDGKISQIYENVDKDIFVENEMVQENMMENSNHADEMVMEEGMEI